MFRDSRDSCASFAGAARVLDAATPSALRRTAESALVRASASAFAAVTACVLCIALAPSGAGATEVAGERRGGVRVELHAERAPLASALEYLAATDGREARVGEDIRDLVSGRLAGTAGELIELLVDAHGLTMFDDASTVWFDREGRRVVDFVRLDKAELDRAMTALLHPPGAGGDVLTDASGKGIVLSGTRAFVQSALARIAMATPAFAEAPSAGPPDIAAAVPAPARPSRLGRRLSLGRAETSEMLGARVALLATRPSQALGLEDGTWLVPGDTLPSGHRIVAVEGEQLLLERDGVGTPVVLP